MRVARVRRVRGRQRVKHWLPLTRLERLSVVRSTLSPQAGRGKKQWPGHCMGFCLRLPGFRVDGAWG